MKVILLERVERLGALGDVVTVKDGFARNFLLPREKALRANSANLKVFETRRADIEASNAKAREAAAKSGDKLDGSAYVMIRQAGESGQLYGSVAARDISDAVTKAGFTVDKRQIVLDRPIKTLGLHRLRVMVHPEVGVTITANVAQSEDGARMQAAGIDPLRERDDEDNAARAEAQRARAEAQTEGDREG
jgi:large subunit ribosomal protein L9